MALLPRLLCKLVAGVHQRTSEHTALYIHRDPSDWMDAGGAHLDTSDAHSPHYYAAERGLSGTVRELLRCLRGLVGFVPNLRSLPLLSPCPSFSWGSPLQSGLCQGAPLKRELCCTWLSKSPPLAVAAVTFNAPQPCKDNTFGVQFTTWAEQWAYTAMSRDRWW